MKGKFITGLITILPIGLTALIVWFLVTKIGGIWKGAFKKIPVLSILPDPVISIIGFVAIILLIYIIGVIASGYIGKKILKLTENLFSRLPVVRTLYNSARELTNAIFVDKAAFKKAVLIEWPRKGVYTIAFVTNETSWEIDNEKENVNLFMPTTPNPTTGFYIVMPRSQVRETNLSIDEALRTIISAGIILPDKRKITKLKGEEDGEKAT